MRSLSSRGLQTSCNHRLNGSIALRCLKALGTSKGCCAVGRQELNSHFTWVGIDMSRTLIGHCSPDE